MAFSSLPFIFLFLPVFVIAYALLPMRWRTPLLFIGSVVFYLIGSWDIPWHTLLLLGFVAVDWLLGMLIRRGRGSKAWLTVGLVLHFGCLVLFKYTPFLAETVNAVFGTALPVPDWAVPAGLSFTTFTSAAYLIDVYRRRCTAEASFVTAGAYLTMFPKLIIGPITNYADMEKEFKSPRTSLPRIAAGLQVFTVGLAYKVLLAGQLGGLWTDLANTGYDSITTPLAWMGIIAYSMQLYFDFYGYSLMAIGLGQMLGFTIPENFRDPYMACSMTDFWRRWHITLGAWFREYIYIPLGGSRCKKGRHIFNLLIVWLFTGIWHGAGLNFLLWGLVLFVIITVEKFTGLGGWLEKHRVVGHLYMIILIPLSWGLFALTDFGDLGVYFGRLFDFSATALQPFPTDYLEKGAQYGIVLLVGLLFCTSFPRWFAGKVQTLRQHGKGGVIAVEIGETVVLLAAFWASFYCMYRGMNDPFMYFRF